MKTFKILFLFLFTFLSFSCEKELDISINDFKFSGSMLPNNPINISEKFIFILDLNDDGFTQGNSYSIKYTSDKSGVFSLESDNTEVPLVQDEYNPVQKGKIKAYYVSNTNGIHKIDITIKNSKNQTKVVTFFCTYNAPDFSISSPVNSFIKKETEEVTIPLKIIGYSSYITYQIKAVQTTNPNGFTPTSSVVDNIYNNIPNTYVTALVESDGTVKIKYKCSKVNNLNTLTDDLIIYIFDGTNTKTISFNFSIKPLPRVTGAWAKFYKKRISVGFDHYIKWDITNSAAFGSGVTIVGYEMHWLNNITGTYRIWASKAWYPGSTIDDNPFHFKNQPFKCRVKDSDGYWSDFYTGMSGYEEL
jgi:hypothetical protein